MKYKILIIEDNLDVRENLSEILTLSGYKTITAANGKLGVESALRDNPDLILCDIMMPELDGYGVLRILSKNPVTSYIPFIFLTAKTEMSEMRKGMTLGADDYITKPFDDVELLDTIEVRLKKKNLSPSSENTGGFITLQGDQVMLALTDAFGEAEPRMLRKKDILYAEGQNCRHIFLIRSGKAVGTKMDDYSKEVITRLYKYPDVIGLCSALTEPRYQETVKAFEDMEIVPVQKEDFIQHILNDKSLSYYFLHTIARDQNKADERLLLQAFGTVRNKLATVLIDLYYAYQSDGKAVIPVPREDLAAMAGTAKETIIRSLSEFKEEGLVSISGSEITIDDVDAIVKLRF